MHIFLTGKRDIGKTTIINNVIKKLPEGQNIGGFRTFKGDDFAPGKSYVFMTPLADSGESKELYKVALRDKTKKGFQAYPEVFDIEGVKILENTEKSDFIIMDELGFMESEAYLFQEKVIDILFGDVPVLGSIRYEANPFLDKIRNHPKVKVIEVTTQNRDLLVDEIVSEESWLLHGQKKK